MPTQDVYNFNLVNIHDRTKLARFCRVLPLLTLLVWTSALIFVVATRWNAALLFMSATMNLAMWLWVVSNCGFCYYGIWQMKQLCAAMEDANPDLELMDVVHLCIIPNYKEDEEMMAETLQSLVECRQSSQFRVVLAMELREGEDARLKGERLKERFADKFKDISVTLHPGDLMETYLDGTCESEEPGKASNLKWAVRAACKDCESAGIKRSDILVTVIDADCLFHPYYFWYVGRHHNALKEESMSLATEDHLWTGYQPPQVTFRNHCDAPVTSRVWSYISMMFELGGVSSMDCGGQHMCFSSFTLPLQLIMKAGSWTGDVVADDHHIFLKCFFYSIRSQLIHGEDAHSLLKLVPVPLPVKSTSVISEEGYWASVVARFRQAKRHSEGVAELEYAVLATLTMLKHVPLTSYSFYIGWRTMKVLMRLFWIHIMPFLQMSALAAVTLLWLWYDGHIPHCPYQIDFGSSRGYLCGLAGSWTMVWPVAVPAILVMSVSLLVLWHWFVVPGRTKSGRVWDEADGDVKPICNSHFVALLLLVIVDICIFLWPVMIPYGIVPLIMAHVTTFYVGNRVGFAVAAKAKSNGKDPQETVADVAPTDLAVNLQ